MALLALAELPSYVRNGIRTVSDATQCALQHNDMAAVGESMGEATRALGPQLRSACCSPVRHETLGSLNKRAERNCGPRARAASPIDSPTAAMSRYAEAHTG